MKFRAVKKDQCVCGVGIMVVVAESLGRARGFELSGKLMSMMW